MNNLITKKEEYEALDVINKKLISASVQAYNRGCLNQNPRLKEITEQEVLKNLKKKGRMPHKPNATNPSGYDMVRYEVKVNNGKFPITFDINKSPSMLYVEWHHQFDDYHETGNKRAVIRSNLREGKFDSIIRSVIKEAAEPGMRLSKKEEKAGYDYLIKVVVPKATDDLYMKFLRKHSREYANERKYPRINFQDVVKNMKKKRTDVDSASYESVINDHVYFEFFLKKGEVDIEPRYPGEQARKENRLLIGVIGPINTDWKWYDVTTV